MLATPNSGFSLRHFSRRFGGILLLAGLLGTYFHGSTGMAQTAAETKARERAGGNFRAARMRYEQETTSTEAAWQFARACFDWAELATNNTQRAGIAELGIAAGNRAVARDTQLAAGHYYLAMNLGELAQTKTLGALRLVEDMEREFKSARALDASFDFAGPERNLGLLYRDAPGWPMSIGNRSKALEHLRKAAELSPDFPDNQLCLLEAFLKWGERKNVQAQLKPTGAALAAARKQLTGDEWATSWIDWNQRWEKIKTKAAELSKPVESPKNQK